jgi:hypothetical protein
LQVVAHVKITALARKPTNLHKPTWFGKFEVVGRMLGESSFCPTPELKQFEQDIFKYKSAHFIVG